MKKIKFLQPTTVEIPAPFDDEMRERTFIVGEIINAKITRETPYKIDINFCGDDIYGIDREAVVFL